MDDSIAYVYGQLFREAEKINGTKFPPKLYGDVQDAPATIYGAFVERAIVNKKKTDRYIELWSKLASLGGVPTKRLSPEDQTRFAQGYYHNFQ